MLTRWNVRENGVQEVRRKDLVISPSLKVYINVKYDRERSTNMGVTHFTYHPHPTSPLQKKKKENQEWSWFLKSNLSWQIKNAKKMGARKREREYGADQIPFMAKERRDRTVIPHQTGKLSASRTEVAVLQEPWRFFIRWVRCKPGRQRLWLAAADLLLMVSPGRIYTADELIYSCTRSLHFSHFKRVRALSL